jgi:hypothetical protein
MLPSITPSTFNATSSLGRLSGSSEPRRERNGKARPPRYDSEPHCTSRFDLKPLNLTMPAQISFGVEVPGASHRLSIGPTAGVTPAAEVTYTVQAKGDDVVTGKLRSYRAAFDDLHLSCRHEQGPRMNNRTKKIRIETCGDASERCSASTQLALLSIFEHACRQLQQFLPPAPPHFSIHLADLRNRCGRGMTKTPL